MMNEPLLLLCKTAFKIPPRVVEGKEKKKKKRKKYFAV